MIAAIANTVVRWTWGYQFSSLQSRSQLLTFSLWVSSLHKVFEFAASNVVQVFDTAEDVTKPDQVKLLLDAYRIELNPAQVDIHAGLMVLDVMELTAGVEDVLRVPYYKAGVTIHYRDDDLLNVIFKTKFWQVRSIPVGGALRHRCNRKNTGSGHD